MDTLDLGTRIQPVTPAGIFRDPDYFVWGPQLIKGQDGTFYLVHSRWPRETGFGGWLTHSEIALATAQRPEGPYQFAKTLLKGRGEGHWDELMVHNPKLKKFGDRYYLYYISSRSGLTRGHIRDSQRTGVAVADSILGPYQRFDRPLIEPVKPFYNVAVNPGVTRMPDGRYLIIIKGDIKPKEPHEHFPQRIQALGIAASPTGPFQMLPEPAIADIDTEDASIWYDSGRSMYYAVFHAHTYIGLITSEDGIRWQRAVHYKVTGKDIKLSDGSFLEAKRLERPSVFYDNGEPRMLCVAANQHNDSRCVLVPLLST